MALRRKAGYHSGNHTDFIELMNLLRLIIITFVIWIAFRIWQNYRAKAKKMPPKSKKPQAIPDMVACEVCKMHIPENEALRKGEKYYCSQQHLENDN